MVYTSTELLLLLSMLDKTKLQDIVHFLCSIKKPKRDIADSKPHRNMKKMRERIAMIHPFWTQIFAPPAEE